MNGAYTSARRVAVRDSHESVLNGVFSNLPRYGKRSFGTHGMSKTSLVLHFEGSDGNFNGRKRGVKHTGP